MAESGYFAVALPGVFAGLFLGWKLSLFSCRAANGCRNIYAVGRASRWVCFLGDDNPGFSGEFGSFSVVGHSRDGLSPFCLGMESTLVNV